jgi:hypothetical protein
MPKQKIVIKTLKKTKRIRKKKKDFFHGTVEKPECKPQYKDTVFPFRPLLLFFLLAATIFLYTPLTFLLEQLSAMHVAAKIFHLTAIIKIPQLPIPQIKLPQPTMDLPVFSITTSQIVKQWLNSAFIPIKMAIIFFTSMTKSLGVLFFQIFRAVFNNTSKAGSVLRTGFMQINIRVYKTILFIFTDIGEIFKTSFFGLKTGIIQSFFWFLTALKEYFVLLGNSICGVIIFLFQTIAATGIFLTQLIIFIFTNSTSAIAALFVFIGKILEIIVTEITTVITNIVNGMAGIIFAVFGWIMQIVLGIKRSIDTALFAISQFLYQFEPAANFITASINTSLHDLFANMGQIFSETPTFFKLRKS